ncbi:alpha/beta fold hydrolase [Paenirhodobacter sp.]|uniref:alpha/beta fold hydrolase n=1 Tax=Paenirhodobacter sp. TaxID=1965326 RepID=UPI003B4225CE
MTSTILRASDGSRFGVTEAGAGAPLVLFHGVGMCAEAWTPQMDVLAAQGRVIAVDLPGHGNSDVLPGAPGLADYVRWAAGVIAALDVAPTAVAGHSMGALIAMGLAVEYPDLVARACLLNPVYRRDAAARAAVMERARALADGGGDPEAPLARWFAPGEAPEARARVARWLRQVNPEGYAKTYAAFAAGDAVYAGRLGEIRCPVLVLTSEFDHNSSPAMTRQIAGAIPGARAVVIPGERHMVGLTAPVAVNRELLLWLKEPVA